MNLEEVRSLMESAVSGDSEARSELIKLFPQKIVHAVNGEVDVESTLDVIRFTRKAGVLPKNWMDQPLTTFAAVWEVKQRLDPYTWLPVTPGTIAKVWETKNGHIAVAAIAYGIKTHALTGNLTADKEVLNRYIQSDGGVIADLIEQLRHDKRNREYFMEIVAPSVEDSFPQVKFGRNEIDTGGGTHIDGNVTVNGGDFVGRDKVIVSLNEARKVLSSSLTGSDVRTLCFDLGVDYDDLPGEGKSGKIRELIRWAERRGKMNDLLRAFGGINREVYNSHNMGNWRV